MPTVIGIIFFALALYCFFYKAENLLGLLILATVFEAASAINIGDRGIQPYYVVAGFIIARALLNWGFGVRARKQVPHRRWLLLFAGVAIISAFVLPRVFAGVPVMDPKIGIDDGFWVHPPLFFGLNNVVQAAFVAVQVATVFAVSSLGFSAQFTRVAYLLAFGIEVVFLAGESIAQLLGLTFPLEIVLNNPGYALWKVTMSSHGTRNPGTFSEPSVAGAFLVLYSVGFLADYFSGKGSPVRAMIAVIASGLVASSSSILALCFFPAILVVRYSPFRSLAFLSIRQAKRIALATLLLVVPLTIVLVFSASFRDDMASVTVEKGDTGSFVNRTASDLFSLDLLIRTHGLGVGLGSNRSSSMVTTLLSNIGVIGTIAFGVFYFKLFRGLPQGNSWLRWGAFALFFNMCLGIADVTMPLLWSPIMLALHLSPADPVACRAVRQVRARNALA